MNKNWNIYMMKELIYCHKYISSIVLCIVEIGYEMCRHRITNWFPLHFMRTIFILYYNYKIINKKYNTEGTVLKLTLQIVKTKTKSIPQTYMTAQFPGLVQALQ